MTKTPQELIDAHAEAERATFRRRLAEAEVSNRIIDLAERSGWHDLARVREIAQATR